MFRKWNLLFSVAASLVCSSADADVSISSNPTVNMNCSGGVCAPTAKKANLNTGDLVNLLQSSDATVVTGAGAVTIDIRASLSWASPNRLTLDAAYNVSIKAPVIVEGTGGALTIKTSDGVGGGDLKFFPGGKIDFWDLAGSLVVNGNSYTLVSDLTSLARHTSGYVALAKDYDAYLDRTYFAPPIGGFGGGILEGLGHAISNIRIKDKSDTVCGIGLIGLIYTNGTVRDVGVVKGNVVATTFNPNCTYLYGGVLVGQNYGVVLNCYATGKAQGGSATNLGGLVGDNQGTIANSSAEVRTTSESHGTVNGPVGNGGLVGQNDFTGIVLSSFSTSTVVGKDREWVGGLVGLNLGRTTHSLSSGNVSGSQGLGTGGLVGWNAGVISYSQSSARVNAHDASDSGNSVAGGLAGYNDPGTYGTGLIEQSFSTGLVQGGHNMLLGGLVGQNSGDVENSYSASGVKLESGEYGLVGGLVSANGGAGYGGIAGYSYSIGAVSPIGGGYRAGFIAYDAAQRLTDNYWNLDTSGISDPSKGAGNIPNDPGIKGLTDAQLKSALPAGFDSAIWGQKKKINNGYPYLLANPPPQ